MGCAKLLSTTVIFAPNIINISFYSKKFIFQEPVSSVMTITVENINFILIMSNNLVH
jgi:hypothetical protein